MSNRFPVLLVLLLLSGLLLAAAGAQGASAKPTAAASAVEEEFEGLEEELAEEEEDEAEAIEAECETAREEADEGELELAEVEEICAGATAAGKKNAGKKSAGPGSVAPQECLLRSAHAHAAVNAAGDKLKLTIGYTAYEPVGAKVEVRKGSSRIATKRFQLGRSGVLRIVEDLGKDGAPKRVVVRVAVPTSPSYCGKYETEKVTVR